MARYSKLKSFIDSIFNVDISTISGNSSKIKVKIKNSIVVTTVRRKTLSASIRMEARFQ
jgi:hypothetical protein